MAKLRQVAKLSQVAIRVLLRWPPQAARVASDPSAVQLISVTSAAARLLVRAGLAVSVLAAGGGAVLALAPVAAHADESPAAAAPLRIMPLGDSLTYGIGSSTRSGYRAALRDELAATGVDVDFVGSHSNGLGDDNQHEGHPGWQINEISTNIQQWLSAAQPDVVLLDIGTNDLDRDYDRALAPARTADLIDRITAQLPTVRVVVAKLLEVDRFQATFRRYNDVLADVVAARWPRVTLADMSRVPAANTVDGVHPTDVGYRQMAYQWYQALRPVVGAGRVWKAIASPYPVPSVRVAPSAASVRSGGAVTVTARLDGRLAAADLAQVPVRLRFRQAGTNRWISLGVAWTDSAGVVRFTSRQRHTGYFAATILAGPARGRHSLPVRVASR
jgi:lysophospholipase L1-like esterase